MTLTRHIRAWSLRHLQKRILPEQPKSFPKTDLALKILTVAAIYAGAGWGLYKYYASGADSWAINLRLETKVLPYGDKLRLLVVNVKSVNPRKFETQLDADQGDVFELRFRNVPFGMKQEAVIDEDAGTLIQKISILPKDVPYDFIPGLQMDDMRMIVVPANSTILVTAEIDRQNGTLDRAGKPDFDFVSTSAAVHIE